MIADDDDLDPSDWLAAQFGDEPPKRATPPEPAAPVQPVAPSKPAYQPPPLTAPPPFNPPPIVAPGADFAAEQRPPAAPFSPPPAAQSSGFSWGLTPGAEPLEPSPPPAPIEPTAPPAWVEPTATPVFPVEPPAAASWSWAAEAPTTAFPAADVPQAGTSIGGSPFAGPPFGGTPFGSPDAPTEAFSSLGADFPGQSIEPLGADPSQWLAAPLDPALDGVTEVFEAELVGLAGPQGEGPGASALDDLFGDGKFRDFSDEPLIAPLPPRQGGGTGGGLVAKPPKPPRAPIPRTQKILMTIAGVLVAALALVALFAIGTRLSSLVPAPALAPSPTPSATAKPAVLPLGPVKPGDYHWDQLLGGECLKPFTSAWQDTYTVVDCTSPHPAQLVFRGTFSDPASATYPGVDELQKRINLLCTPATIINYAVAGTVHDIQVLASFAPSEDDWDNGNHDFFCFVNRSGGGDLTASVAVPQVAPTPTPTSSRTP